ncbi:MAG: heme exporter protein CcmD [Rhodovibrionaceae bacterium]|nr:heme exporter protein CcmD [Rhodovibrionaceae bacterium]
MQELREFLWMNGYAAYVWPAFILTAVVLAGLLASTLVTLRRRERRLAQVEASMGRRRRRAGEESAS